MKKRRRMLREDDPFLSLNKKARKMGKDMRKRFLHVLDEIRVLLVK